MSSTRLPIYKSRCAKDVIERALLRNQQSIKIFGRKSQTQIITVVRCRNNIDSVFVRMLAGDRGNTLTFPRNSCHEKYGDRGRWSPDKTRSDNMLHTRTFMLPFHDELRSRKNHKTHIYFDVCQCQHAFDEQLMMCLECDQKCGRPKLIIIQRFITLEPPSSGWISLGLNRVGRRWQLGFGYAD